MANKDLLKSVFADDPEVLRALETRQQTDLFKHLVKDKVALQFIKGDPGEKGDQGPQGERGERGPQGEQGEQGLPGKDGNDGIGLPGATGDMGPAGKDGKDGKDGVDGKSVTVEEVISFIKDLSGEAATDFGKKVGALIDVSYLRNANSFMFNGKKYKIEELMHGGGSTTSGLNVTTQYILTAVQSGSDVTIDLTQLTNYATFSTLIALYRNNVPQTQGVGYNFTISGSTVTVFNADAGELYNATYSYA